MERMAPMQLGINLPEGYRHPSYVRTPWSEYLKMYEAYASRYGYSQSAERICERGGLGVNEVVSFGILEINLYLSWSNTYPKEDKDWTHLHLIFEKDSDIYHWKKIKYGNGYVEGDKLILPRVCLVRLQKYYEEKENDEKACAKLELINELIGIIDKKKEGD